MVVTVNILPNVFRHAAGIQNARMSTLTPRGRRLRRPAGVCGVRLSRRSAVRSDALH
jgi:hypothetical protein